MIYIFGDSHARFNFKNLPVENQNLHVNSITMHRVGRDNEIINFRENMNHQDNTFIITYGEVDCRCHIHKQLSMQRDLNEIVQKLVDDFCLTISNKIKRYKKIIVCSVVPPIRKSEAIGESPEFPRLGTDEERVLFTKLINEQLKINCNKFNFVYFDIYNLYARDDGTLDLELSDKICHIQENELIINKILEILK
jgi:hypothetical protein